MSVDAGVTHLGRDEGDRYTAAGALDTVVKVRGESTGGVVAVAEHIIQPGTLGAPMHTHSREDEISFVTQGTIGVQIGDEVFEAGAGTTVFKPKGIPHAFWNASDSEARFVEVFGPAGLERYFEELEPLIPADGPPDLEGLQELQTRYGLEMDIASMPELIQRYGLRMPG
jgi:quercetin dioxygenase-like cupin family protein